MNVEVDLAQEAYDNYRAYVNPPLARVMKLSGSPVEVYAEGSVIVDSAGKRYLDFAGGYGVFTLGHRHPRVVAAVRDQLDRMALSGRTMFNPLMGRLAKRLAELTPGDLAISFFANSGAEAVEGALKLARAATRRPAFVSTDASYHGKTFGALSVSGRDAFRDPFAPLLADVRRVPFGDARALRDAVDADVAAVIVEPVQGEGGVNVPPPGYLRDVRAICDASGAVLIADEVQTGLGRCGSLFACERDGVVPDVMTLAKGLSGGVIPIGAYIARPAVWNAAYGKAPLLHTSTFGGNELACAAALAALDVLVDEDLVANVRERGAQLLAGARATSERVPQVIAAVRGAGLLVGVELQHEGYGGAIIPELLKRGVTAAWTLNQQRVIRLEPPLNVSEDDVAAALRAFDGAVDAAYAQLGVLR
ncbi:acetylornithine/acetyl-lysine aminotransferase [Vulcanimicrobium alpinum]|uniref:Acetylornithine/acetyl-lysine aminotransferase n=1 Tax=Vulcanimicrobium alpinum TaxID=3016050 RepID=A0AAN1XZ42_UNVUL|nr:aspartate aminotransferase family protein [Vulcanimicrobium alpinum]BDE07614.1 acetylornithine/acetyl-lysine aminotransferase [Vulcanimicrobium alpinum]